ncbi:MAG: DUF4834 family protein [Bacteroidetes bacterium]|nr:DUF4834 family protein [Bacteroidota bacterium]
MLKVILIIIIIYFALQLAARYLFPLLIKYFIKRVSKKFQENINNAADEQSYKKEGETHIEYNSEKKQNKSSEVGEYVDFEEIE